VPEPHEKDAAPQHCVINGTVIYFKLLMLYEVDGAVVFFKMLMLYAVSVKTFFRWTLRSLFGELGPNHLLTGHPGYIIYSFIKFFILHF
jgi:hypothetical protein